MLTKKDKISLVKDLSSDFQNKNFIILNYEGITVEQIEVIRNKFKKIDTLFLVIKNTLLKRVLENNKIKLDSNVFQGMSAVAWMGENFAGSGKILLEAEKGEQIKIKEGYFEGKVLTPDEVRKISSIPSKEELYSNLIGGMMGVMTDFVFTLKGIIEKKEADGNSEEKITENQLDKNSNETN